MIIKALDKILRNKSMVYETVITHFDPPDLNSNPDRQ